MNNNYGNAVKVIKTAILNSQLEALKSINEKQLILYYAIGKYISLNTRKGKWGESAIDIISKRLDRELPGLRGFSSRNLRNMRTFYEEWKQLDCIQNNNLEDASAKIENITDVSARITKNDNVFDIDIHDFLSISFSNHSLILSKIKSLVERLFYLKQCLANRYSYRELKDAISSDEYHHRGQLPNNFSSTISNSNQVFKAINSFKDQYLLRYVNTEEIDARDKLDVDERAIENGIVHNIKKFILTFGKDFAFIGNQYHLEVFGEDQYVDLLFFNRELNCLVAVELKTGEFKTSYLGQLSGYLSILDKYERKEHENPPIGIILCKDMNKSFVDFVIRDYNNPMGVSTYKDMSEKVKQQLPSIEELAKLLDEDEDD